MKPRRSLGALLAGLFVLAVAQAPVAAQSPAPEIELKFSAFFRQPIGPRGLEISDTLRAAQGQRVLLVGYMVAQEQPTPGSFMLTPRPVRMSEHADGDADDLPAATVTVHLADTQHDHVVMHREGLISLRGRLDVGRREEPGGRVSWVRLQLDPDAVAAAPDPLHQTNDPQPVKAP